MGSAAPEKTMYSPSYQSFFSSHVQPGLMINLFFNDLHSSDVHMKAETVIQLQIFLHDTHGRESLVFCAAKLLSRTQGEK